MPRLHPNSTKSFTPTVPDPAAFGRLRSKLASFGYSQQQIKDALGVGVGGRDKSEIVQALEALLRAPAAKEVRGARVGTPRPAAASKVSRRGKH